MPYCYAKYADKEERLPMRWNDSVFFGSPRNYLVSEKDTKWRGLWLVECDDYALAESITNAMLQGINAGFCPERNCRWMIVGNPKTK